MKQTKIPLLEYNEPKKLAATVILMLAFLAFLWEIGSAFRSPYHLKTASPPAKIITQQTMLRADSPLFTTALFGDYVPTNLSDTEIKKSMLDVEIVGIMFSDNKKDSQVIIRTNNGEEKYYIVGDTLPGGAVIKHISAQGIVVLHNGSLESLSLPKNELLFESPAKPLIGE